jgi:hypothetical protein
MDTTNQPQQQKVSDEEYQAILASWGQRSGGEGDPKEAPYQGPVQLALWRDRERAVPTAIIRSALFGVVQRGRRPYVKQELLASWKNCEIRYTGLRLNQYDEDVWMLVLHMAREQDLSAVNGIRFTARGFLRRLGGTYGGARAKFLYEALERMTATAVSIRVGTFVYVGGLIDSFVEDEATGEYVVRLNPKIAGLFGTGYTKIEAEIRRRLSSQIARHLYGYVQSHKATPQHPHRIGLARLQAIMGSESDLKKFRWNVRRAMEELQRDGVVASWRITEGDALEFVRPRGQRVAQ